MLLAVKCFYCVKNVINYLMTTAVTKRKKPIANPLFMRLMELEEDHSVKNTLSDWARNKFPKEVRYNNGVFTVKGKYIKSYNISNLSDIDKLENIRFILKEYVWKKQQPIITPKEKLPHTSFSSMNRMTKSKLIKNYVTLNQEIPVQHKKEYKDTIQTGLLIKTIIPSNHVCYEDGEIKTVNGVYYSTALNKIILPIPEVIISTTSSTRDIFSDRISIRSEIN
jgi:hypothetical protein